MRTYCITIPMRFRSAYHIDIISGERETNRERETERDCITIDSMINDVEQLRAGIRGTVVSRWTTSQQVERSILCQGHDSQQNSSHSPRLLPAQYSLNIAGLYYGCPLEWLRITAIWSSTLGGSIGGTVVAP